MRRIVAIICFTFWGLTPKTQTVGIIDYEVPLDLGYILFAPNSNKFVYLIDPCGYKINEWSMPSVPGMIAKLNNQGELIYAQRESSPIFNGGGIGGRILSYSWDGEQLWNLPVNTPTFHQHHDMEILPNNNILVLGWEFHEVSEATAAGRETVPSGGLWSETIREYQVDETGEATVVWEWRSWDHVIQDILPDKPNYGIIDQNPGKIDINFAPTGANFSDWMHANSLDYNPELDQIIINIRNFAEFWVIDHSTTIEEAKRDTGGISGQGGQILYRWGNPQSYKMGNDEDRNFYGQHDAHWIDQGLDGAGSIMIFNNGISRPEGNYSTIETIDPPLEGFTYNYDQTAYGPLNSSVIYGNQDEEFFFSSRISGSQRLPNGNTLICSGVKGTFFEVNSEQEIVWKYVNPSGSTILEQGDTPGNSIQVFQAIKYAPDFAGFAGKTLDPIERIELNPIDNCDLNITNNKELTNIETLRFNSWIEDMLYIEQTIPREVDIKIYNTSGMLVYSKKENERSIALDLQIQPGVYFMGLSPKGEPSAIHKIYVAHE